MFCQQCGSQLPEGSKFCHVCGVRTSYADYAQQISEKLHANKMQGDYTERQSVAGANISPGQAQETLLKESEKKRLVRWIVILAIVIFAVLILGAVLRNFDNETSDDLEADLSKTYTNETEGILFQYSDSDAWEITDTEDTPYSAEDSVQDDDICFNGILVSELLGLSSVEVVQRYGLPDNYGDGLLAYDEWEFNMWDDQTVGTIMSFYPEYFSVDGCTLNVDSDGVASDESVIELLGQDYEDEWLALGYYMTYRYPTCTISFCINKFCEVEHILIRNPFVEEVSDDFYDNITEGDSEPIENYYGLAGFYIGSTEQSTLSLSIYSSQEEGEIAIGVAEICEDNGFRYSGQVVVQEKDVYRVIVDMGEKEIFLVVSTENGEILVQLYKGEERVEEYHMVEAYES